jgi:hypothetical protein
MKKMKKVILGTILVIMLVYGLILPGCIRRDLSEKNGPVTTQTYDYTGFTGVDVGSALQLEVTAGDTYSVTITAGNNLFDHIRVTKSGDILKIYTEGWSFSWWWGNYTPKVTITMPVLETLYISGAADGTVTGFKSSKDLSVKASGASKLNLDMETGFFVAEVSGASNVNGRLVAKGSDITLSGASDINISGSAGDLKLSGSGASTASLRYFTAHNGDVAFSGASNGSVNVSGTLDVNLSGASDLNYYGNPTIGSQSVTGASDLHKKS